MQEKLVEKPANWPRNNGEANLSLIMEFIEKFKNQPNYKNKEILFSLIDVTDINEIDERGEIVFCEYETAILNHLYLEAMFLGLDNLKIYLYGYIARKSRLYKFSRHMGIIKSSSAYIKEYEGLAPTLRLFYYCYAEFNMGKEKDFSQYMLEIAKDVFYKSNTAIKENMCAAYTLLLYDLSFSNSVNVFPYLCFGRNDIKSLFGLCAQFNKVTQHKANERPLMGTLKISLRQWILKSRNYYSGSIYKSISAKNILSAYSNNQVWMSKTKKLNDKREQKVIRELFAEKKWLKYEWAKKVEIRELDDSFVCSFSTKAPSEKMRKKYGGVVLGYKSDRIANLIAPITLANDNPRFDQVAWYDIIYDRNIAKCEINYLCEIIDMFDLTDDEKSKFLEDIMVYWYLSFKDKKWSNEYERRYQIFMFDYKQYADVVIESDYLKMTSSLYTYPDFILTDNKAVKNKASIYRKDKTRGLMTQDYYFCNNCLQSNRVLFGMRKEDVCPICGSTDITFHRGM